MAAHQAPPSLGFSRPEHWSGLPFPSPKHESEKWKWSRSVVSYSSWPHGLKPTRLLHPWDFPGKSTGVGLLQILMGREVKKKTVFKFLTSSSLKSFSVCKVQISSLQRYSVLARGYGNHRQFDLILIIRNLTSDLTGS